MFREFYPIEAYLYCSQYN